MIGIQIVALAFRFFVGRRRAPLCNYDRAIVDDGDRRLKYKSANSLLFIRIRSTLFLLFSL